MKRLIEIINFLLIYLTSSFLFGGISFAGWPGQCIQWVYTPEAINNSGGVQHNLMQGFTLDNSTGFVNYTSASYYLSTANYYSTYFKSYYYENGQWNLNASSNQINTSSIPQGAIPYSSMNFSAGCPNPCTEKAGQENYKLQNYPEGTSYSPSSSCDDGCQMTAEVLWSDCITDQCVASVKYTYTGNSCTNEPEIDDLQPNPPPDCQDEIKQKIAQCGGSLNVLSFDFNTCTGECTPDSCQDQWAALLSRCGGIMGVASWDAASCSGTCASDPVPQPSEPDEKPPQKMEETVKTNPDGSKEVTNTTTFYNETTNTTYKNETTTTYDSAGNQTGQTTTTSTSSGNGEEGEDEPAETFSPVTPSGFGTAYNPGQFNIPDRFNTFLGRVQNTGLFSFSSSFFNGIPGGGSPVYEINGGETFGQHTIDLSQTLSTGLAVLKTILLACFGFLSIRALIMKR